LRSGPDDPGVVDQHVEAACGSHHIPRRNDRRIVGDIHRHKPRAEALGSGGATLTIPGGNPDTGSRSPRAPHAVAIRLRQVTGRRVSVSPWQEHSKPPDSEC